jgi:hypothetical protein
MSVTGKKYDPNSGVRRVTITSNPQLNPLSATNTASQNYYCLALDNHGMQYQIDLQAVPPEVTLDQIRPNQVWWVEKRTTLYRLYLYGGVQDPVTLQVNSTAPLPPPTTAVFNNVTITGTLVISGTTSGTTTSGNYLPITGGTIAGDLTVENDFTVNGSITTQNGSNFVTFDQSILNLMGAWG